MDEPPKPTTPQEIVLITRSESQQPNPWSKAEQAAKVLSLVAIPVILAVLGWLIQDRLAIRNVSQDYVKVALSILTTSDPQKIQPALRNWAVDLLNQNSPTKFTADVIRDLKAGELTLPASLPALLANIGGGQALAVSRDGKKILTGQEDGSIRAWDLATGRLVGTTRGHEGPVTSVAVSPDGQRFVSGSMDGTARVWDFLTMRPLGEPLRHEGAVVGVAFLPDGKVIVTKSLDGTIRTWDATTSVPLGPPMIFTDRGQPQSK